MGSRRRERPGREKEREENVGRGLGVGKEVLGEGKKYRGPGN